MKYKKQRSTSRKYLKNNKSKKRSNKRHSKRRISRSRTYRRKLLYGGADDNDNLHANTTAAVANAVVIGLNNNIQPVTLQKIITEIGEAYEHSEEPLIQQAIIITAQNISELLKIKQLYEYILRNKPKIIKGAALILAATLIFLALKKMDVNYIKEQMYIASGPLSQMYNTAKDNVVSNIAKAQQIYNNIPNQQEIYNYIPSQQEIIDMAFNAVNNILLKIHQQGGLMNYLWNNLKQNILEDAHEHVSTLLNLFRRYGYNLRRNQNGGYDNLTTLLFN